MRALQHHDTSRSHAPGKDDLPNTRTSRRRAREKAPPQAPQPTQDLSDRSIFDPTPAKRKPSRFTDDHPAVRGLHNAISKR